MIVVGTQEDGRVTIELTAAGGTSITATVSPFVAECIAGQPQSCALQARILAEEPLPAPSAPASGEKETKS